MRARVAPARCAFFDVVRFPPAALVRALDFDFVLVARAGIAASSILKMHLTGRSLARRPHLGQYAIGATQRQSATVL